MHHSESLSLTFVGLEQGLGGKNCLTGRRGKPCLRSYKAEFGVVKSSYLILSLKQLMLIYKIKPFPRTLQKLTMR